jgi:hypothetical protein
MVKAPVLAGAFLDSYLRIEDWRKLFCNGDVVYFVGLGWLLDLTWGFVGEFE